MAWHTVTVEGGPFYLQSYGDALVDLPAAPQHESHAAWIEAVQTMFISVNVAGAMVWRVQGSSSSAYSKYWVNPAGKSPTALYNTVLAGVTAAAADWLAEASTGSRDVIILPGGTFVESFTLPAGVNLIALQGERTSPSYIQGTITTGTTAAQTNTLRGIRADQFVATGAQVLTLELDECLMPFASTNTNAASTYKLRNTTCPGNGPGLVMGTLGTLLAEQSTFGTLDSDVCVRDLSVGAMFRGCHFHGQRFFGALSTAKFEGCDFDSDGATAANLQTAGSSITVLNCKERALLEPVYTGTGTLNREGVNVYVNASTSASTITEAGSGATVVWQTTKFSGVGPHSANALARCYLFLPGGAGAIAVMTLLTTQQLPDHVPVTFINRDPSGSQVQLVRGGADTIDGATTLLFRTSITLLPDRATGTWFGTQDPAPVPASPTLYVASTGSDAASTPGTSAAPLLTLQEACNRLRVSGWTGTALIITKDTINLGANPNLTVPVPPSGDALPICFRGTLVTDVAALACTGGTAGTFNIPVAGMIWTSGVGMAANTHRGKILAPLAGSGALAGTWQIIHSNDAAGIIVTSSRNGTPLAGYTADIYSRGGIWTWSGSFKFTHPGGAILDYIELRPTGASGVFAAMGGLLQENATRWVTAATFTQTGRGVVWACGPFLGPFSGLQGLYTPTGMIPCGCRYDAAGGLMTPWQQAFDVQAGYVASSFQGVSFAPISTSGGVSLNFLNSTIMNDCGVYVGRGASLYMSIVLIEAGRAAQGSGAVVRCDIATGANQLNTVTFGTVADPTGAAVDLIMLGQGAQAMLNNIGGSATTAGKLALNVTGGGAAVSLTGLVCTGGTATADVAVDGGTSFPIADAVTMGVVGSQNGSFQHSTSNLTPNPTINKFSGFGAVAVGATTSLITNSLADVGDHVEVTAMSINATVAKFSAVATLNLITITTDAAATVADWSFSWRLVKATV